MKKKIKNALTVIMIFAILCTNFVSYPAAQASTNNKILLGDLNGNNKIDELDYLFVKRFYFKTLKLTDDELFRADVNQDKKIDAFDYLLIKRMYFGTYAYQYAPEHVIPHELSYENIPNNLEGYQKELIKYMFQYLENPALPNTYKVNLDTPLKQIDTLFVSSFATYYFGRYDLLNTVEIAYNPANGLPSSMRINTRNYMAYNESRKEFDKTLSNALSKMKNGSAKFVANQIAHYICDSASYNSTAPNVDDLVNRHIGSCNAYAMTFYRMCLMAGIECDIVYGYANGYHCWNRIKTENGNYLYYDLTFYESSESNRFVASEHIRDYVSVNRFLTNKEIEQLA